MFVSQYDYREDDRAPIPTDLDDIPPGPQLARALALIDISLVSGYDRVVVLRAHQKMASHYTGHMYRDMVSLRDVMLEDWNDSHEDACASAEGEIRVALTMTRRAAVNDLMFAINLHERLPRVAELLVDGRIDVRRAKTVERQTMHLSEDATAAVVDAVYDEAPLLNTAELGARIRELCIEAAPEEAKDRYNLALEDRRVVMSATESGTANFMGLGLAPDRVATISNRINKIAMDLCGSDESRTMDQLRSDVFLDILDGNHSKKRPGGVVDIRVDLETLAELNDHPGDLAGFGPVIADIARRFAAENPNAEWRVVTTDPETGEPIHTGVTRRRPTADQRRQVEARDVTCIFPGCRVPATKSDLDHRIPYADGGHTETCCLAPICRHDHCLRHAAGWTYERLASGQVRWRTRLGHSYTTAPYVKRSRRRAPPISLIA
jgi:hypothetical protein